MKRLLRLILCALREFSFHINHFSAKFVFHIEEQFMILHNACIVRANGSKRAEILEWRSQSFIYTRHRKRIEFTMSRTRVPCSIVQVCTWEISTRIFAVKCVFSRSAPEPVGSKAPAFQSDAKSSTYVRNAKSSLALTCAAQASPPPSHR